MPDNVAYKIQGNFLFPYPLGKNYDPSGPYSNPGGTMPGPGGSALPAAVWNGSRNEIMWTTVADVNNPVAYTATWQTPVFDYRPDLGSVSENRANITGSKPIWQPSAQVWVQMTVTDAVQPSTRYLGMEILAQEWGHIIDLQQLAPLSDFEDVTAQFTNTWVTTAGRSDSVVAWYPIGDSNPIRYYQLKLTINLLRAYTPTPPELVIQGAAY